MTEMTNETLRLFGQSTSGLMLHENERTDLYSSEENSMDTEDLEVRNGVRVLNIKQASPLDPHQTLYTVSENHVESEIHLNDPNMTEQVISSGTERANPIITVQTSSTSSNDNLASEEKEIPSDHVDEPTRAEIRQVTPIQFDNPQLVLRLHPSFSSEDSNSPGFAKSIVKRELKDVTNPPEIVHSAPVAKEPEYRDHKSLKELVEEFEKLKLEIIDFDGERMEQEIQKKVLDEKRILVDKFNNLSMAFSKINRNIGENNDMIQKVNTELGVNYPLEKLKEFSVSDTDEHILMFAAVERKKAAAKKEGLSKKLEATKLNIAIALGFATTTNSYCPSQSKAVGRRDVTTDVAKILADNASLQVKLDFAQKAQAQAETFMDLHRDCHLKSNNLQKELAALKQDSETIEANIPYYRAVAQFCSRVRHGFHHSGRRVQIGGSIRDVEGREPSSKKVINIRNEACHEGDIATDFALFMVDPNRAGWDVGGERYIDFTKSYRITPEQCKTLFLFSKGSPPGILLYPLNMHATMYRCYFNTTYHCGSKKDGDFEVSFEKLFAHYQRLLETNGIAVWTARYNSLVNFLKNEKQAKISLDLMKKIVQNSVAQVKVQHGVRA
ncbi:hypothetical protein DSL72_007831 [Monilinia vaccinii-corymbosi]|uniref:Uncharacterized protein n=1 Tax=Monilinia vaccinii-corymbosi TaxID=61207 RepID=A0A8A3PIV8_9HELO|nr:hypothetical protein DSL72_007831 [Monilinia vaccinii-corymbosi]